MRPKLLMLALAGAVGSALPAHAYPFDCAILLCMAGGFPANAHCARAKAEVIRRITPLPVEPPLQVWRCPMGGGSSASQAVGAATLGGASLQSNADDTLAEFYRRIEYFEINYGAYAGSSEQGCIVYNTRVKQGLYDAQGDFSWVDVDPTNLPDWLGWRPERTAVCPTFPEGRFRGVGFRFTPIGAGPTEPTIIRY